MGICPQYSLRDLWVVDSVRDQRRLGHLQLSPIWTTCKWTLSNSKESGATAFSKNHLGTVRIQLVSRAIYKKKIGTYELVHCSIPYCYFKTMENLNYGEEMGLGEREESSKQFQQTAHVTTDPPTSAHSRQKKSCLKSVLNSSIKRGGNGILEFVILVFHVAHPMN